MGYDGSWPVDDEHEHPSNGFEYGGLRSGESYELGMI